MSNDTPARRDGAGDPREEAPATVDGGLNWDAMLRGSQAPVEKPAPADDPIAFITAPQTVPAAPDPTRQPQSRREARAMAEAAATGVIPVQAPAPASQAVIDADPDLDTDRADADAESDFEPIIPGLTGEPGRPSRAERRAGGGELYPAREQKKRPGAAIGCLVFLLIFVGIGVGAWFALQGPIQQFISSQQPAADYSGDGSGEVLITIHEGDIGEDIARTLHDEGVTASFDAFYDLLLGQATQPVFQPGTYRLAEKMSAKSALAALEDPANKLENTVLITEGMSAPDALQQTADALQVPIEQVQAAAANPQAYGLPAEATSLEGFLFPATYTFDPGTTPEVAIQSMVDLAIEKLDAAGVAPEARWNTVILASIVQREAGSNLDDFPKVARVFQNRLDQGMNLESDATVAYGTGNTHTVWTTDEERADASNLYNTYANPGLPVGPIGNPGDVAIAAALAPADGPWLFFVPVNLQTGETVFSTTADEHSAAVEQLHEWCAASEENNSYCE